MPQSDTSRSKNAPAGSAHKDDQSHAHKSGGQSSGHEAGKGSSGSSHHRSGADKGKASS